MYFVGDLPEPEAIAIKAKEFGISTLKMTRIWIMNCGQGLNVRAVNQIKLPKVYARFLETKNGQDYQAEGESERDDFVSDSHYRNCSEIYELDIDTRKMLEEKRARRISLNRFAGPILDEPFWRRHLPHWHMQNAFYTKYNNDGELKPAFQYLLSRGDFRVVCNMTDAHDYGYYDLYDNELFDFIDIKVERHLAQEGE